MTKVMGAIVTFASFQSGVALPKLKQLKQKHVRVNYNFAFALSFCT